jgi:hypothetical protein
MADDADVRPTVIGDAIRITSATFVETTIREGQSMAGRVIQGFFIVGSPRPTRFAVKPTRTPHLPPRLEAVQTKTQAVAMLRPPGPPTPWLGRPPAFAHAPIAQASGGNESFQVDPIRLGLASYGGKPLPDAVRSKMESALGADFSDVRVHAGPQADRIGAIAFTIGSDLYFAPGRFQPDTMQGQQLLGHELAHVVQQRQGRVRSPTGSGVAVVQDRALEAEADRLGQRAAAYRGELQAKVKGRVAHLQRTAGAQPVQRSAAANVPSKRVASGVIQRVQCPICGLDTGTINPNCTHSYYNRVYETVADRQANQGLTATNPYRSRSYSFHQATPTGYTRWHGHSNAADNGAPPQFRQIPW